MDMFKIEGVQVISPTRFQDNRGEFAELYNSMNTDFLPYSVRQISRSRSKMGVIRGLHFQYYPFMPKILDVTSGRAVVYVVDVRPDSSTFGQYDTIQMSEMDWDQLYVPHYCAVGFEARSLNMEMTYYHGAVRNNKTATTINWNDPDIGIDWIAKNPILSDNDTFHGISLQAWKEQPASLFL